jgi:hypothetical protein
LLHRRLHRTRAAPWRLAAGGLAGDARGVPGAAARHADKLCRLRFFGGEERWGFAFYTYSSERYELSMFPSGEFLGPPEEAFQVAAGAYLC